MLLQRLDVLLKRVLLPPQLAVTFTRVKAPPQFEPHAHLPSLQATDFLDFLEQRTGTNPVLAEAHARQDLPPDNATRAMLRRILGSKPALHGRVWLTAGLLHYQYPCHQGMIVMQHVIRAEAVNERLDIVMPNKIVHLHGLCRSQTMAIMINAILRGDYDPAAPFRPACRSCRHLTDERACGAQPPPITNPSCCQDKQHLDWCPVYRPMTRSQETTSRMPVNREITL